MFSYGWGNSSRCVVCVLYRSIGYVTGSILAYNQPYLMYKCVFCYSASVGEEGMGSVEGVGRGCEGECGGGWERMLGGV